MSTLKGGEFVVIDGADFEKAARALSAAGFEDVASDFVKHALRQSANVLRNNVKAGARKHHRTGRLEGDIHTTWKGAGLAFQLRIAATGPVAHLIIGGVRPHTIVSRTKVMTLPGSPRSYAREVRVGGFRGDPFLRKGLKQSIPAIQAIVTDAGKTMAADLAKRMEGKR